MLVLPSQSDNSATTPSGVDGATCPSQLGGRP